MDRKEFARNMLLIAACILAYTVLQSGPVGLRLAVQEQGVSFRFTSAIAQIAFDIGQECSKSDGCGLLR